MTNYFSEAISYTVKILCILPNFGSMVAAEVLGFERMLDMSEGRSVSAPDVDGTARPSDSKLKQENIS